MNFWIIIAAIGIILSMTGITVLIRRYLKGEITLLYLVSIIIGFLSFIAYIFFIPPGARSTPSGKVLIIMFYLLAAGFILSFTGMFIASFI